MIMVSARDEYVRYCSVRGILKMLRTHVQGGALLRFDW